MEIAISSALTCTPPVQRPTSVPCLPFSSSTSSFFNPLTHQNGNKNRLVLGRIKNKTKEKKRGLSCNCLFGLGVPELVVIAGVAALVFGPKKLPEVGRSIGKTVKSFQQAAKEFETELKKEPDSAVESLEKTADITEQEKDTKVSSTQESI